MRYVVCCSLLAVSLLHIHYLDYIMQCFDNKKTEGVYQRSVMISFILDLKYFFRCPNFPTSPHYNSTVGKSINHFRFQLRSGD